MNKYLTLFGLSWQKQLEVRSDFFFERTRSLSILISIYFLWSTMLSQGQSLLGYSRDQLLTYVLVMTILRAWVLACITDRIPMEIAKGMLSDILLRPISHLWYWATQDAASKTLNIISAVFEVAIFSFLVGAPFLLPESAVTWFYFAGSVLGGMIIYFQMSYLLGVIGFWTAQSWGPRFCFEIVLEFCAGAYFPIDLLPGTVQRFIQYLPFPYLIFSPVSIYLGRFSHAEIIRSFAMQFFWIMVLGLFTHFFWKKGLRKYAAEGR